MRGNLVMKGYLKNPTTTEASFSGGWFHSGDLAVWHPDGYIEIKDRSKTSLFLAVRTFPALKWKMCFIGTLR